MCCDDDDDNDEMERCKLLIFDIHDSAIRELTIYMCDAEEFEVVFVIGIEKFTVTRDV